MIHIVVRRPYRARAARSRRILSRACGCRETIISHLEDVKRDPRIGTWANILTKYAASVSRIKGDIEAVRRAYGKIFTKKEFDKMVMTTAEALRLEGAAKTKAEGMAEIVSDILTDRFGKIPVSLEKKINAIQDPARFKELGRCAATCKSLNDFKKAL